MAEEKFEWKEYLDGRGSGSGKYETYSASRNRRSVEVQHLPEDIGTVRIVVRELDVTQTYLFDEVHAHCLWAALCGMAENKKWQLDFRPKD